jgi:hypothetical protein
MKIKIENLGHLTKKEVSLVSLIASSFAKNLEQFYNETKAQVGEDWFVYRGGSHVALHRESGDSRRCLIATE